MNELLFVYQWMALHAGLYNEPYIACDNGVMCVPITSNGDAILIHEPQIYHSSSLTLLLPAGVIETGEDAAVSANRELQEEIGFRAGRLHYLATLHPWSKYMDTTWTIYLARDLMPNKLLGDEACEIISETVPLNRFKDLIAAGRLTDSTVIAALFLARRYLNLSLSF